MKQILLLLTLLCSMGCKTFEQKVKTRCDEAAIILASTPCAASNKTKVVDTDSSVTADSAHISKPTATNEHVVNTAVDVFKICDSVIYTYVNKDSSTHKKYTAAKLLHAKAIDKGCPELKKLTVSMDHYYAVTEYKDGKQRLAIYRRPHTIVTSQHITHPVRVISEPYYEHWYFWAFIFFAAFSFYSIYKNRS